MNCYIHQRTNLEKKNPKIVFAKDRDSMSVGDTIGTAYLMAGGGTTFINEIYPNPSRDIFNIRFTSEEAQDLQVRILNIIGEEVSTDNLQQFEGEYIRAINLNQYRQ